MNTCTTTSKTRRRSRLIFILVLSAVMLVSSLLSSMNVNAASGIDWGKAVNVTKVGCYIYDANGRQLKKCVENCSRNESTFYVWYDIKAELRLTLKAKTTYKYKLYVIYNGKEYATKVGSFKTK